jgi:hypothetical protein
MISTNRNSVAARSSAAPAAMAVVLVCASAWGVIHDGPSTSIGYLVLGAAVCLAILVLCLLEANRAHRGTVGLFILGAAATWPALWIVLVTVFRVAFRTFVTSEETLGPVISGVVTGAAMGYVSLRVYGCVAPSWKAAVRVAVGGAAAFVIALLTAEVLLNNDDYAAYVAFAIVLSIPGTVAAIALLRPMRWLSLKMGMADRAVNPSS